MKKQTVTQSDRYEIFIEKLISCGSITKACECSKLSKYLVNKRRKSDKVFDEIIKSALEDSAELLEDEAKRRAVDGVDEPKFYKGEIVGSIKKYSDSLLIALLKANYPEKYAERTFSVNMDIASMLDSAIREIEKKNEESR